MTGGASGVAPRKHPHAASRIYEGEAFIVLPLSHKYKILNQVGTLVWDLIDGARTAGDLALAVQKEYEVSYETALKDVNDFLAELSAHGMLADGNSGKVT